MSAKRDIQDNVTQSSRAETGKWLLTSWTEFANMHSEHFSRLTLPHSVSKVRCNCRAPCRRCVAAHVQRDSERVCIDTRYR
jgi:hypothetical protein